MSTWLLLVAAAISSFGITALLRRYALKRGVIDIPNARSSHAVPMPRGIPAKKSPEFSFSGLKTAAADHVRRHGVPAGDALRDCCASVQEAICDVLT
jgi:tRNA A37 threonylcarbamoyltransferase TsaD